MLRGNGFASFPIYAIALISFDRRLVVFVERIALSWDVVETNEEAIPSPIPVDIFDCKEHIVHTIHLNKTHPTTYIYIRDFWHLQLAPIGSLLFACNVLFTVIGLDWSLIASRECSLVVTFFFSNICSIRSCWKTLWRQRVWNRLLRSWRSLFCLFVNFSEFALFPLPAFVADKKIIPSLSGASYYYPTMFEY